MGFLKILFAARLFCIVSLCLITAGCVNSLEPGEEGTVLISRNQWTAPESGGKSPSIELNSYFDHLQFKWRMEVDSAWLHVSRETGITPSEFTVRVDSNLTGIDRSATIRIIFPDIPDSVRYFDIIQPHETGYVHVGSFKGTQLMGFTVSGDYAYISGGSGGLKILNISDPYNPHLIGWHQGLNTGWELAKHNNLICMMCRIGLEGGQFYIFDVSSPGKPTLLSSSVVSQIPVLYDVAMDSNYIYIVGYGPLYPELLIYDISDPGNPVRIEMEDQELRKPVTSVFLRDGFLYCGKPEQFRVYDISDPYSISVVGETSILDTIYDLYVEDDYAYGVDWDNRLQILDVSSPASPILIGELTIPGDLYKLHIDGGYAYIADNSFSNSGVHIVDISDPSNPVLTDKIYSMTECDDVYARDGLVYITARNDLSIYRYIP